MWYYNNSNSNNNNNNNNNNSFKAKCIELSIIVAAEVKD